MDHQNRLLTRELLETVLRHSDKAEKPDLAQILLNFLEVLDSLDRLEKLASSVSAQPDTGSVQWAGHLQTLREQLLKAFEQAGVTFFDCTGFPFDPERHRAVEAVQRSDVDDYTVVEQVVRGCEWHGKVLRFAQVIVARRPSAGSLSTAKEA